MKEYFSKIAKAFSRYRDWLVVALVVGGIAFFLQKIQAEQNKDPEAIWQSSYPSQVAQPEGMIPGMPGAQPEGEAAPVIGNSLESFAPMEKEKIESISYNPIFTHSDEYNTLLNRLKQLRTDFQDAQDRGDIKTAIERLRRYVEEDPYGKRFSDWTTEPQELLRNLVCNELVQSVEAALSKGEEDRQSALGMVETEPDRAIESIREVRTFIERTLREVEASPECLEDSRISSDRIEALKSLQTRVVEDAKNLEDQLVRQKYDRVLQQGSALGGNSSPDQVAQMLQSIQDFRSLLEGMGAGALSQQQIDRLADIETTVQSNKENLINQVQQQIDQLAAEPDAETDHEKVQEILRQFSVLKLLGESESKIISKRRQWEQVAKKLEATHAVEELQELLKEIKNDLDQAENLKEGNQDISQVVKRLNNSITQFEQIRKNTKSVSSVPAFKNVVSREFLKQKRRFDQLRAGLK